MSSRQREGEGRATGFTLSVRFWPLVLVGVLGVLAFFVPIQYSDAHHLCHRASCTGPQLQPSQLDSLRASGLSLDFYAVYVTVLQTVFALIYCAIAALIYFQRPRDRMKIVAVYFLTVFGGVSFPGTLQTIGEAYWPVGPISVALALCGTALLAVFFCLFPSGRFVPRHSWVLVILMTITQLGTTGPPNDHASLVVKLLGAGFVIAVLSLVIVQIYRYRQVSTPIERQQTKWVVLATAIGFCGFLFLVLTGILRGSSTESTIQNLLMIQTAFYAFMILIPISIAIAMLRYRLWDVDVIIRRTLVYLALTLSLGAVYIGSVIAIQGGLRALTGQGSNLAIALSTLAIAALFQPFRRRIQAFIDLRFYRKKYDAARTLATFSTSLRDEVDLDHLGADLTQTVRETFQPAHVSLWLRRPA